MSNSVQLHRWQPTRLPRPWDSPGKNTGVVCHYLLQCMKVKSESEVPQSCPTLSDHGLQPTRFLCPWDFPGKSTGVGCHCLLQSRSARRMKTDSNLRSKPHTPGPALPAICRYFLYLVPHVAFAVSSKCRERGTHK